MVVSAVETWNEDVHTLPYVSEMDARRPAGNPEGVPAVKRGSQNDGDQGFDFDFDFILEKPATRPRDRCGKEQLIYPFVTGFPGSSRVSALAPYSSGDRVGSALSTPHAGGDLGLFVGECSSPQTDAPNDDERVRLMSLTPPP